MKAETVNRGQTIVLISHEFSPFQGGVATYCGELAAAIHRAGRPIVVWAPAEGSQRTEEGSVPIERLRCAISLRWRDRFALARRIERRRHQLRDATVILGSVGAHMAFMIRPELATAARGGIVSLLHGSEVLRFGGYPAWRLLARRFFPKVHRVVTPSRFVRSLIEESFLGKLLASEIQIAPCAPGSAAMQEIDAAPQAPDGRLRILTLARLHPRKGQLDTARAIAMLPAAVRANLVYQVAGGGDRVYLEKVRQVCAQDGVRFEYLGAVPDPRLAATYAQCDIFAMTSRALAQSVEGFGISYLEAAWHGKPVVAYRTGGVAEAVRDDETGFLVDEGNLASLAAAIEKLVCDPALRRRMGDAGRRHARSFSWDKTARVFLDALR